MSFHIRVGIQAWIFQIWVWNTNHYITLACMGWLLLSSSEQLGMGESCKSLNGKLSNSCWQAWPWWVFPKGQSSSGKDPVSFCYILLTETKARRLAILLWLLWGKGGICSLKLLLLLFGFLNSLGGSGLYNTGSHWFAPLQIGTCISPCWLKWNCYRGT